MTLRAEVADRLVGHGFEIVEPGRLRRSGPVESFRSTVGVGDPSSAKPPDPTVGVYCESMSRLVDDLLGVSDPHRAFSVRAVGLVLVDPAQPAADWSMLAWVEFVLEAVQIAEGWQDSERLESVIRSQTGGWVVGSQWCWLLGAARLRMGLTSWSDDLTVDQALELSGILEEGLRATQGNAGSFEQFSGISDRLVAEWQLPEPASPHLVQESAPSSRFRRFVGRDRKK